MHRIYSSILALAVATAVSLAAQPTDADFARKAAAGGDKEVASAKLASTRAANAQVKAFANRLVRDHTAANQELTRLMKTKKITVDPPSAEAPADEAWKNESGPAFDNGWVDAIIADHKNDIAMFQQEVESGTDAQLKSWASKKLPTLKAHLKAAEDLKTRLSATTR